MEQQNLNEEIIYVGKAKDLKKRVSQYFMNFERHDIKTRKMVPNILEFEYIVTDSETEALILECNLIKKNKPKYNLNNNLVYKGIYLELIIKIVKDKIGGRSTYYCPNCQK